MVGCGVGAGVVGHGKHTSIHERALLERYSAEHVLPEHSRCEVSKKTQGVQIVPRELS